MISEQREALVAESQECTKDGALDFRRTPATKAETGGWRAAPLIFGMELCERMASLGLQRNLVTYLHNQMNFSLPKAANAVSNFVGTLYLTPFLGGFLADAYLGRFLTINIFASVQLAGMVLLTLSAVLPSLRPPACTRSQQQEPCPTAHGSQVAVLFVGLYLIALGNGGIKPNVSSMGADQFDEADADERKHMSSFFNWFYFVISIGSLLSITVFVYLQDNVGFGLGFGIPSALLLVSIFIFICGAARYRYKRPGGSAFTRIAQVIVAATRKLAVPHTRPEELYEDDKCERKIAHTDQFSFLDKAAVVSSSTMTSSSWQLCSVSQVEEVKMVLRLLPIWASTFFVWTALAQMETFSVEQGATMRRTLWRSFNFPPASMSVFELVNVLVFLPLYDRYFIKFARKLTGQQQGVTPLQRIGIGIAASILSMVAAALVEARRLKTARSYGLEDDPKATVPISIFWLAPQYFLRGTTEIFTQVGQLEFFYKEAPEQMRSFGTALYLSTIGVGHFLSTLIVTVVNRVTAHGQGEAGWLGDNLNRSKLSNFYWLLAALSCVNLAFYLCCSRWYRYKATLHHVAKPGDV